MPDGATIQPATIRPEHVRAAGPRDAEGIFTLLCAAHEENGWLSMNPLKVRVMVERLVRHEPGDIMGLIGVIDGEKPGTIAGAVALLIDSFWYSDEFFVSERFCFVDKGHRRSSYAKDLIQFAKWFADDVNLPLEMGVLSTHRTEAKVRLYRRQLQYIGGFFAHGMDRASGPLARGATS